MLPLGYVGQVEAHFGLFGDSVNLRASKVLGLCRSTIGSEIIWMHPMLLLGDVGQVEACFGPFGDGVNLDAR
jgi:hypothetical protein